MEKIIKINEVLRNYFETKGSESPVRAKEMMPHFISAGIFPEDKKNGLPIRALLRKLDEANQLHLIPYVFADRKEANTNWFFQRTNSDTPSIRKGTNAREVKPLPVQEERAQSDESYVLDLCDEVLNLKGLRQHKFDFLLGDAGTKLPVDLYYKEHHLVIEYREYQHTNAVKHFDKPDKMTVSGVHRGEQRKIYDQRRRDVLPAKGINLIEIDYTDFAHSKNRIVRDKEKDLEVVKISLKTIK